MTLMLTILVDGLVYSAWLFIVSVGLTLVFGVMRVLNIAHGSLYAIGAYLSATLIGLWFDRGLPELGGFAALIVAALSVGILLGLTIEQGLLRWLQGQDEVAIVLATFALFLILEDAIQLVWGVSAYPAFQLYGVFGTVQIGSLAFNVYDLSIVLVAGLVAAGLWFLLKRTELGGKLRVLIHDRETAEALGINVRKHFTGVFILGAVLGALGGAYSAPMISVAPGIAVDVIILAFAVVVIGGLGSIEGAVLGALFVGVSRATAVHMAPQLELFVIYGVMTLVLLVRPEGLFAPVAQRRI